MAAINAVGTSVQSTALSVIAARVPITPSAPSKKDASTTSITVKWTEPDNRGSPITSYQVHWNGGGSSETFTLLATVTAPTLEYSHKDSDPGSVTPGQVYKFKVLATNAVGDSLLSAETEIKAATVPSAPAKPTLVDQ